MYMYLLVLINTGFNLFTFISASAIEYSPDGSKKDKANLAGKLKILSVRKFYSMRI